MVPPRNTSPLSSTPELNTIEIEIEIEIEIKIEIEIEIDRIE